MAWSVTARDSIDLDSYTFLPFGRFSQAEPFVQAFTASDVLESDLVNCTASNVSAIRRAIVKLSGLPMIERDTGKKTKHGKTITAKTVNASLVRDASATLGITLEVVANSGDGSREFVQLRKVA